MTHRPTLRCNNEQVNLVSTRNHGQRKKILAAKEKGVNFIQMIQAEDIKHSVTDIKGKPQQKKTSFYTEQIREFQLGEAG